MEQELGASGGPTSSEGTVEYELYVNDEFAAGSTSKDEILHYVSVYAQDGGEMEVQIVYRSKIDISALIAEVRK